jgi:hypothetical protein
VDNRYKLNESNPKAGKRGPVSNAFVDAMVDVVVPLADGMDRSGGIYAPPSHANGILILLDLRGGAQYPAHRQLRPGRSGIYRDQPAARRRCCREGPV